MEPASPVICVEYKWNIYLLFKNIEKLWVCTLYFTNKSLQLNRISKEICCDCSVRLPF